MSIKPLISPRPPGEPPPLVEHAKQSWTFAEILEVLRPFATNPLQPLWSPIFPDDFAYDDQLMASDFRAARSLFLKLGGKL